MGDPETELAFEIDIPDETSGEELGEEAAKMLEEPEPERGS